MAATPAAEEAADGLAVRDVRVAYSGGLLVLHGVDLEVRPGETVALLGANGAGKSTMLKAISGLLGEEGGRVTDGTITWRGESIHNGDPSTLVRGGLVHVMEGRHVLEHMTVEQNLVVAARAVGIRRAGLTKALEQVHSVFPILRDLANRQSGYLSGGQRQMLVMGRALMVRPKMLLLDEPSLGLAPVVINEITRCITHINSEWNTGILVVEQNLAMALSVANRGYVMESGQIAVSGTAEELRSNPRTVESYLGREAG